MALALALAACGSSPKHAVSSATATTPSITVTTQASSTTPAPPQPSTTGKTSTAGASNVRLPATFTITSGDRVVPSIIGGPAGVTVDLTLISADGKAHTVKIAGHALSVPAGGRATVSLSGLAKSSYELMVDGAPHATLVIGAQPGP